MKKIIAILLVLVCLIGTSFVSTGCDTEAQRVSYNVSQQADNFNVMRRFVAINVRSDKIIMEVIGKFSVQQTGDGDVDIIVEVGDGVYKKNWVRLTPWVTYSVEDISGAYVDKYHYEVNYQPEAIIPITIVDID
jgi:maltose-binding protein MalE